MCVDLLSVDVAFTLASDSSVVRLRGSCIGRVRRRELYAVTLQEEVEPVAAANRVQAWTVGARAGRSEHGWDGRGPQPPGTHLPLATADRT